ncbi:MAG: TonB-dependent receptor [Pseudomonadota bacterium]
MLIRSLLQATVVFVGQPAFANDTSNAFVESPATLNTPATLIITARRLEESAQEVPVSVVNVTGKTLEQSGITTAQELQQVVSGLQVSVANPRLTQFTLRGLGSSSFNEGLESSVALFIDGIYLGRQSMSIGDLIDIERVEVARGPQGTLFGKNATAGTIHVITRKPQFSSELLLDATVGSEGTEQYRGSITGPLSDTLAFRLTGWQTSRDGLLENRFNGDYYNDRNRDGLRGQLLWVPTARLSTRVIAEYSSVDEQCCGFPLKGEPSATVKARDEYVFYDRVSGNPFDRIADLDVRPSSQAEQYALSSETQWDFALRHRLVSLTAWRDFRFQPLTDDNTSLDLVQGGTRSAHQQFSQELRIDSRWQKAESVVGLYVLDQTTSGAEYGLLGKDISQWVFGGLIREQLPFANRNNTGAALNLLIPPETFAGMRVDTPFEQRASSVGLFGSLNWHATDQLDLVAGLRYTHEWKSTQVDRMRSGGNPNASPLALTNNLTPLSQLIGVDLGAVTFNQLLDDTVGGEFHRDLAVEEGALSGNAGLSWRWTPSVMTYLTYSRGVKSGGVNLGVTGERVKPAFRPEIADSVELGLKSLLWSDRLLLNLAIYDTWVKDYQALTFDESPTVLPNPRLNNLLNVGKVRLTGADLDFQAALPYAIGLRGGISYNRAITEEFTNAPDEDSLKNTRDLSGQPLVNAPTWSGNVGVQKQWALQQGLAAYVAFDYHYRSRYNTTIERSRNSFVEGYGIAGARLGLASQQGWDASFWVRNLFDQDHIASIQSLYGVGAYGAYAGEPRIFGTTLRLRLP